jgi:hypothetical protein
MSGVCLKVAHSFHREFEHIVSAVWDNFCRVVLAGEIEHPDPQETSGHQT